MISHSACLELVEDLRVALGLIGRRERMHARELFPADTGYISLAALSFIVQEPSGIIDVSRPTSLRSRLRM